MNRSIWWTSWTNNKYRRVYKPQRKAAFRVHPRKYNKRLRMQFVQRNEKKGDKEKGDNNRRKWRIAVN